MELLGRLVAYFRDYHAIEPRRTVFDLDADPPAYAASFADIYGQISSGMADAANFGSDGPDSSVAH